MLSGHARGIARGAIVASSCCICTAGPMFSAPGEIGAAEAVLLAHYGQTQVLSVDYRMPPDHPFPAALDDAVAVYQAIAKTHKPAELAVFGTSAGGGLAAAMLQKLRLARALQCPPCWDWAPLGPI